MRGGRHSALHAPGPRSPRTAEAAPGRDGGAGPRRVLLRRIVFWVAALLVAALVVYLALSLWFFDQALEHPDRSGLDGWLCDPDRDDC
mgnify:CR=1 FL=1